MVLHRNRHCFIFRVHIHWNKKAGNTEKQKPIKSRERKSEDKDLKISRRRKTDCFLSLSLSLIFLFDPD